MPMTCLEREYLVRERQEAVRHAVARSVSAASRRHPRTSLRERAAEALLTFALRLSPGVLEMRRASRGVGLADDASLARA